MERTRYKVKWNGKLYEAGALFITEDGYMPADEETIAKLKALEEEKEQLAKEAKEQAKKEMLAKLKEELRQELLAEMQEKETLPDEKAETEEPKEVVEEVKEEEKKVTPKPRKKKST